MTNPITDSLNPAQKKAVEILDGPLLILAGAGSGKTKCLTHRIANLMANGIPGSSILAVTFTNKAAMEMRSRVESLLKTLPIAEVGYRLPTLGTFHSVCVRILRQSIDTLENGLTRNFVIFDVTDQRQLLKIIMKDLGYDEKEFKHRAVHSHISTAKNQLMNPDKYAEAADVNKFTKCVYAVYKAYQKRLIDHNALDFDDLLYYVVQLLETSERTLAYYRNKWSHLLIDEYQDTNFAQYRIVRLLGDIHQNVCAIGDDHQSIYSFRGADYTNILQFEGDYPNAATVKLEQNYRSSKHILACANSVIDNNRTGRKKDLWTENPSGELVQVCSVQTEREEADLIAKLAQEQMRDGGKLSNMAVLYRMNAQSRALEESLMRHRVPYNIIGGVRFFDRKEIKDIVAYLRLVFNPQDDIAFLRVINIPKRQLGQKTLEVLKTYADTYTMSMLEICKMAHDISELNAKKQATLVRFYELIMGLKDAYAAKPISLLIDAIIEKINYKKFLDDGTAEGESRIQNVQELFSVAARYDATEDSLAAFLEGVALLSDLDRADTEADRLTLMTIHSSKGLEWDTVALPGWETDMFPSSASQMNPEQLEEERRLAYVAITRAKKKCALFNAQRRMIFGRTEYRSPSLFLSELAKDSVEMTSSGFSYQQRPTKSSTNVFNPSHAKSGSGVFGIAENTSGYTIGERVEHPAWGQGTIITIRGDVLSIAFSGKGVKQLVASVAPLEKVTA